MTVPSRYCWCAIYTRQSRSPQAAYSSCKAQFDACFAYIRSRFDEGWVCNGRRYDDEGESGEGLERPGIQRLLCDIEAGRVDRVVTHRLDRLSRSVTECVSLLELFRDQGIPVTMIATPELDTSAESSFVLNLLASFADFERTMTRDRFDEARAAHKGKGRRVAGLVPYGYRANPDSKQLELVEEEADKVREMFRMAHEGKTPSEIAAHANERGWRTKARVSKKSGETTGGNHWTPRQVLSLLGNPVYAGLIRDGDGTRDGIHSPIVGRDILAWFKNP